MDIEEEDEAPPLLVAAGDATHTTLTAKMKDVKITKVPITIITGRHMQRLQCVLCPAFDHSDETLSKLLDCSVAHHAKSLCSTGFCGCVRQR